MTYSEYSPWSGTLNPDNIGQIVERLRFLLEDSPYTVVYSNEGLRFRPELYLNQRLRKLYIAENYCGIVLVDQHICTFSESTAPESSPYFSFEWEGVTIESKAHAGHKIWTVYRRQVPKCRADEPLLRP